MKPKYGYSTLCLDNWTVLEALYYYLHILFNSNFALEDVSLLLIQGRWNDNLMQQALLVDVCNHIAKTFVQF